MKQQFQNLEIQCWEHRMGYGPGPSICLQAEAPVIARLLEAIDELLAESPPARRKLTLGPQQYRKACRAIQMKVSPPDAMLRRMSVRREEDVAVFEFTPEALMEFRRAVLCWHDGGEDFRMEPGWTKRTKTPDGRKGLGFGRDLVLESDEPLRLDSGALHLRKLRSLYRSRKVFRFWRKFRRLLGRYSRWPAPGFCPRKRRKA